MVKQPLMRPTWSELPALCALGLIRLYQLSFSAILGRHCRHLPSCSEYTSEAIGKYGLWAGGWMGFARICRCRPGGTDGLDFVPERLPEQGSWTRPWRYGLWKSTNPGPRFICDGGDGAVEGKRDD